MSTDPKPKMEWLRPNQDRVRYNAPQDGRRVWEERHGKVPDHDPYTYANTIENPPEILEDDELKEDLYGSISSYLESIKYRNLDEFGGANFDNECFAVSGEVMGMITAYDRTIETPLVDVEMFGVGFVQNVQTLLRSKWRLWRVQVCGTRLDGEGSLMIYPDFVFVDQVCCPPNDLEESLASWQADIRKIRDRTKGAELRQWKRIKSMLQGITKGGLEERVTLLAVFDNWRGEFDVLNFRFLYSYRKPSISPVFPKGFAMDTSHKISREGIPSWETTEPTPYQIVGYTIPKSGPHRLVLECHETHKQWIFDADTIGVITDEELKEAE